MSVSEQAKITGVFELILLDQCWLFQDVSGRILRCARELLLILLNFYFEVPLIAPDIANAALYWKDSTFSDNPQLLDWSSILFP